MAILLLSSLLVGCHTTKTASSKEEAITLTPAMSQQIAEPITTPFKRTLPALPLQLPSDGQLYQLPNGDRFYGRLNKQLKPNSVGLYYPKQDQSITISAHFQAGKILGEGRRYEHDRLYQGELHPTRYLPHGKGIMLTAESRYEGGYCEGMPCGRGQLMLITGEYAIGETKNGHFSGDFYLKDGEKMVGTLHNGHFQGNLIHADGSQEPIETDSLTHQAMD